MRIGISTASYFGNEYSDDALIKIGAAGCRVAEVFLDTYSEYTEGYAGIAANRARQADVEVTAVHAMGSQFEPQLFSPNGRQRGDALRIFEDVMKAGRRIGATKYVFHGPGLMWGTSRRMSFDVVCPIINELIEAARGYDMEFCWENVSWCLLNSPEYVREIAKRCDGIGFVLDIKQAIRSNRDPFEYLGAMGESLRHVHVCDFRIAADGTELAMPGKGDFDFGRLFKELCAMGYNGDAILEVYSALYDDESAIIDSFTYLKQYEY